MVSVIMISVVMVSVIMHNCCYAECSGDLAGKVLLSIIFKLSMEKTP
jgi:hypothetical protein